MLFEDCDQNRQIVLIYDSNQFFIAFVETHIIGIYSRFQSPECGLSRVPDFQIASVSLLSDSDHLNGQIGEEGLRICHLLTQAFLG